MLWLVWHMWILLLLAFAGGVIAGWVLRSRSDEAPEKRALMAAPSKPSPNPEPSTDMPPAPHVPAPEPSGDTSKPSGEADETGSKIAAAVTAPEVSDADAETSQAEEADASSEKAAGDDGDDLTAIKGLGPKAAEKLNEAGVTRLSDIAAWSEADIETYDELINARGRIARDDWVGQAKALSKD